MWNIFKIFRRRRLHALDPDEIFLDQENLPAFNRQQFEGEIEKPIKKSVFYVLAALFILANSAFLARAAYLQLWQGEALARRAANNGLTHTPIFAERGIIEDRFGVELAWNDPGGATTTRRYINKIGFGHLLGYTGLPNEAELKSGEFFPQERVGRDGVERYFHSRLHGQAGIKIEEVDVRGQLQSDFLLEPPKDGEHLRLAVDSRIQEQLALAINHVVSEGFYEAGAGMMMDIETGEVLALTSLPEYDPSIMSGGTDRAAIKRWLDDARHPFLNRVMEGLYTPGSVVKPFVALGALAEGTVSPEWQVESTGSITVPNPYDPEHPSVFKDFRAYGWVDMRRALAVSANTYFYAIGGGYKGQPGIGIYNIHKYTTLFGLGRPTGIDIGEEAIGVVPTPEWKAEHFNGDPWRLGDTYHTVIGQYGFQVTLAQLVRAVAGIANGGRLVTPTVLARADAGAVEAANLPDIKPNHYTIVREGMRRAVTEGTVRGLDISGVAIAAKTGTAEIGSGLDINSLIIGFFPYERPRYAFGVVLQRGLLESQIGAVWVMRQTIEWMLAHTPEYFGLPTAPIDQSPDLG